MDDLGKFVVKNQERMQSIRSTFDSHCQEVAELVLPAFGNFFQNHIEKGAKRTQRLYEGTAPEALKRYASAMVGWSAPGGERWQTLKTSDDDLNEDAQVKDYLDRATDLIFKVRYDPGAKFEGTLYQSMLGMGAFGNGCVLPDQRIERNRAGAPMLGLNYRPMAFSQIYFKENAQGIVDWVHRRFRLTVRQAALDYGRDNLPDGISKYLETDPDAEFDFIHMVKRNDEFQPGALGRFGMPYSSTHVAMDEQHTVRQGGFRTLRYAIARGQMAPGEIYGRGPSMSVLPEIKSLNEMRKVMLRQQHLSVAPPTLLHSKRNSPLRLTPAAQNYGMLTADGKPLAQPFNQGQNFAPLEKEMERIRALINDAFMISLFQILQDRPKQTATETLQRAKEQAIIVGPEVSRLHAEFFGSITRTELEILEENGALPEMPDVLKEAGEEIEFVYESEITRAQRIAANAGYQEWLESNALILEAIPDLLQILDHEALLRKDAVSRGIPQIGLRSDDDFNALREQNQAQQAEQQQIEQAPNVAQAAKLAAEAQQISNAA